MLPGLWALGMGTSVCQVRWGLTGVANLSDLTTSVLGLFRCGIVHKLWGVPQLNHVIVKYMVGATIQVVVVGMTYRFYG